MCKRNLFFAFASTNKICSFNQKVLTRELFGKRSRNERQIQSFWPLNLKYETCVMFICLKSALFSSSTRKNRPHYRAAVLSHLFLNVSPKSGSINKIISTSRKLLNYITSSRINLNDSPETSIKLK